MANTTLNTLNSPTPEEFLNQADINFQPINSASSQKTNFYIIQKNFAALVIFNKNVKIALRYLKDLINIDGIVNTVLLKIQDAKTTIAVNYDLVVGTSELQTSNSKIFQVSRAGLLLVEITSKDNPLEWNVDRLIVQVKNLDGVIVYPVITTKNNKISIDFVDSLSTNYTVYFM